MHETLFLYLFILAHLTGDFLLQTNRIAQSKARDIRGLLLHAAIVTAVQLALLAVFGVRGILAAVMGGILHFLIDWGKQKLNRHLGRLQFLYFLFDQGIHLAAICGLTLLLAPEIQPEAVLVPWAKLLVCLSLVIFALPVAARILLIDLFPFTEREGFFRKNERITDAAVSFCIFILWLIRPVVGIPIILLLFLPYYAHERADILHNLKIIAIKYSFFVVTATLLFFFSGLSAILAAILR